MARELVQKDVDGRLYEFEQFSTTLSLKTLSTLTRIIGEPLIVAMGAINLKGKGSKVKELLDTDLSKLNPEAMSKAVAILVNKLDDDEVVALVKRLTSEKVLCDHKPIVFDEHFRGEVGHLFKVIKAGLEAQYGNFLSAVAAQATEVAERPISIQR